MRKDTARTPFLNRLSHWLGFSNPTRHWLPDPAVPLVLDLDRGTLAGVSLGAPLAQFEFLGPGRPTDPAVSGIEFRELGVSLDLTAERDPAAQTVRALGIYFAPAAWDGHMSPFAGEVVFHGRRRHRAELDSAQQLVELFGPPTAREDDGQEMVLTYQRDGLDWTFEYSADDDRLCAVFLSQQPRR